MGSLNRRQVLIARCLCAGGRVARSLVGNLVVFRHGGFWVLLLLLLLLLHDFLFKC